MTAQGSESAPSRTASALPPIDSPRMPKGDDGEEAPQITFTGDVNIMDALLKDPNLGEHVEGTWRWNRMEVDVPIRSLTADEFQHLNERWTVRRRIGRTTQISTEMDIQGYNGGVVVLGCLNPNFEDPEVRKQFAEKFGQPSVNDADSLVKKVFLPGELAMLTASILELTGFIEDEETVKSLKD